MLSNNKINKPHLYMKSAPRMASWDLRQAVWPPPVAHGVAELALSCTRMQEDGISEPIFGSAKCSERSTLQEHQKSHSRHQLEMLCSLISLSKEARPSFADVVWEPQKSVEIRWKSTVVANGLE